MKFFSRSTKRLLLAFTVLLWAMLACRFNQTESEISIFDKSYVMDPRTILDALAEGNKDVFTTSNATPEEELTPQSEAVNWSQADYLRIADALHQFVWNETLEEMDLYYMYFSLGCNETENGFQYGQFKFFKIISTGESEVRVTHGIEIEPNKNSVAVWETQYRPNLADWKSIDLAQIKISADEALHIAENDAGKEKRAAVNNACDISISISRDTIVYDGWIVDYSPSIFFDKIDPSTGK